jgi:hypothetical protein
MAWKHGADHHVLTLREGDIPEILKDHHAMHELHHVLMESEARKVGRNRWFVTNQDCRKAAFSSMDKEVRLMQRKGYDADAIAQGVSQLYHGAVGFLYNCPLDMLIEQRIARDFPEISEIQFCGVAQLAHDALTVTMRNGPARCCRAMPPLERRRSRMTEPAAPTSPIVTPCFVRMMAAYNTEMNRRLFEASARLSDEQRRMDRGAFWGSIHGTLNHILRAAP